MPTQARTQVRHERILDAALAVFSSRGYRDAAVDDIAEAAETSKGGVYFHFPGKQAIFLALLDRSADLLLSRIASALESERDPVAKVDAALYALIRLFGEHRSLARLFLVEALAAGPELRARLAQTNRRFTDFIRQNLDQAVRLGAIEPLDTTVASQVWFGALNQVVTDWALADRPGRLEDAYPAIRLLLLRSVGVVPGRAEVLRAARERARQLGRPALVSTTERCPTVDAAAFFARAAALGPDRVYWERPDEGLAFAGAGVAWRFDSALPSRFEAASDAWRDVVRSGSIESSSSGAAGPTLLGGFSFDPSNGLWPGFAGAGLILPRILLTRRGHDCWLTSSVMVAPDADVDLEERRLVNDLSRLSVVGGQSSAVGGQSSAVSGQSSAVGGQPQASGSQPPAVGGQPPAVSGQSSVVSPPPSALRPPPWSVLQPSTVDLQPVLNSQPVQPPATWREMVADATAAIRGGELRKVVLARAVEVEAARPFDLAAALSRLRAAYPTCAVFAIANAAGCFLGATPERLVRLRQGTVEVTCLAGTTARGETPAQDEQLGRELLASAKNRQEHAYVVEVLRARLAEDCAAIEPVPEPALMKVRNVQHLFTPLRARLRAGRTLIGLVGRLHPSPAVGGVPREPALAWIRRYERLDRGWYAGPVGWIDARGEGEYVVAIRSAWLRSGTTTGAAPAGRASAGPDAESPALSRAVLFAGCGVVADSEPESEYQESLLKLAPMLSALGGAP